MLRTIAALLLMFPLVAAAQENSVFQKLVAKGVALSNGKNILLPPPVMADGLTLANQLAVFKTLVPPEQLSDFLAGRTSSPYVLLTRNNDVAGNQPKDSVGHRLDLYYIANGSLSAVGGEDFVRQELASTQKNLTYTLQFYTDQELKDRNLAVANADTLKERYLHADILLANQLKLTGSAHCTRTTTPDSVLFDFLLDPRFADDPTCPNQWQRGRLDKSGKLIFDKPEPYSSAGGYMKVTRLQPPPGLPNPPERVFVECHLAFDEPNAWFGGDGNMLGWLPNLFAADVRKFRDDLHNYERRLAAARTEQAAQPSSNQAIPAIPGEAAGNK